MKQKYKLNNKDMETIKARLQSQTFNAKTRFVAIPLHFLETYDDDTILTAVTSYILNVTGYKKHLNEKFNIEIKL